MDSENLEREEGGNQSFWITIVRVGLWLLALFSNPLQNATLKVKWGLQHAQQENVTLGSYQDFRKIGLKIYKFREILYK